MLDNIEALSKKDLQKEFELEDRIDKAIEYIESAKWVSEKELLNILKS